MIISKYKENDYFNLNFNKGEKLCIFSFSDINKNDGFLFSSIIELKNNVLIDHFNVWFSKDGKFCSDNENEYYNDDFDIEVDKSILFKDREKAFIKNNAYYFKLSEKDELNEFLRFITNDNVYSYLKNICCDRKNISPKMLTYKYIDDVFPKIFTKEHVDNKISYLSNVYNSDKNAKTVNQLTIKGINTAIIIALLCNGKNIYHNIKDFIDFIVNNIF